MKEIKGQLNEKEYLEYIEKWKLENDNPKKVFLECLCKIHEKKEKVDWKECVNYNFYFIYEDIEGWIKIKKYTKKGQKLLVEYKNKEFTISTSNVIDCKIGRIIGKITSELKIEIGTRFKDEKRDIIITDRKREQEKYIDKIGRESICNKKWYKYKCNKCGWSEGWIEEGNLFMGRGCSCCSNRTAVLGINTIWDTDKWMCDLGVSEEDAKTHTKCSDNKIFLTCPNCGKIKNMAIVNIYTNKSIGCSCADRVPYPEKFMFSVLKQLDLNFQTQLNKTIFEWCENYRYDFYFEHNNEKYIIETHGIQHYQENNNWKMCLEEIQKNDKLKKELALSNDIKKQNYIVIDCRYSDLEWIKGSVLKSKLIEIFNLNTIDWIKVESFSLSNLIKSTCKLWETGSKNTMDISYIVNFHRGTIISWLKKGNKLGWCTYNPKEEMIKNGRSSSKPIEIFKDGMSLGAFESAIELERKSEKLFGKKLLATGITSLFYRKKQYKGFTFKQLTEEQIKEIQENAKLKQAI